MKTKKTIVWIVIVAAVAAVIALILLGRKPQLVINTAVIGTGTVETTVMATGYIQPVEEVEVGTQVSGVIEKIYVDFNSHVTAGQLLAELDKSTLQERVTQANASLSSAQSDLLFAQQNFNRVKQLHDAKAATDVSLEEATNKLEQAKTVLADAQANANQAKVNLSYAYIYSPINGVILDRQVNVGQTVAASFSTPTLFTIAEDLTKMQVEVDVDEADIGQVREGQRAVFTVDAYSGDSFQGTVMQVRLQPTVTNNVVTYTIIVDAPNPEQKLFPGMTASITIEIESETDLVVPIEALNFTPTAEILQKTGSEKPDTPPVGREGEPAERPQQSNGRRGVWVKSGGKIERRRVETGITDGIHAIVVSGLEKGEEVVLSASMERKKNNRETTRNPLMPTRRR